MAVTKNYLLVKPVVGGSENEWGGNLNDDLDKIDALLGGDQPLNDIDIASGSVNGAAISGQVGGVNDVSIHPNTEISGKVKELIGLDNPDGRIVNVDVKARNLEVSGRITEGQAPIVSGTTETLSVDQGTIHAALINQDQTHTYNLAMPLPGQSITLMLNKLTATATNVIYEHNGVTNAVKWIGGEAPELDQGINVIRFWTANAGNGAELFAMYSGVAS